VKSAWIGVTALAIGIGAAGCGSSSGSGSAGWTQWTGSGSNGHWYQIVDTKADWETANTSATAAGHNLVTITSDGEEQFIVHTFLSGANAQRVFWIGANDKAVHNTFVWVTGEAFSYTDWKDLEPSGDGPYLCINWNAVRGDPPGQWNDAPNAGTTGYDNGANDGPYASIVESSSTP
jgi:hypothetical protein